MKAGVISQDQNTIKLPLSRRQRKPTLREIHATIARKTIRAPFSGVLGIRQVNLGQYLAAGQRNRSAASSESDLREFWRTATDVGPGAESAADSARDQRGFAGQAVLRRG